MVSHKEEIILFAETWMELDCVKEIKQDPERQISDVFSHLRNVDFKKKINVEGTLFWKKKETDSREVGDKRR
jgi:hypothetical protein